jgi:hypothetical protein
VLLSRHAPRVALAAVPATKHKQATSIFCEQKLQQLLTELFHSRQRGLPGRRQGKRTQLCFLKQRTWKRVSSSLVSFTHTLEAWGTAGVGTVYGGNSSN